MGDRAVDADYELACQRPEVSSAISLLCEPAVSLYRAGSQDNPTFVTLRPHDFVEKQDGTKR
jgi:hypothetical protein